MSGTGAVPDQLVVFHNVASNPSTWRPSVEPLYDEDGDPLWLEHPVDERVDVIALPLTKTRGALLYPYSPTNIGTPIVFGPSDGVSIIGFPFGLTGGGALGIWVQGTVATEPIVEWEDLPCLLIDSRTRPGQSGSPVIVYRTDGYQTENGSMMNHGVPAMRFVGVYSGRVNERSDLGFVWKASALVEILDAQYRGPLPKLGNSRAILPEALPQ